MKNKKGLSSVVATLALIAITIVAIGLIASFIISFVNDNLNDGTECIGYEDYFSFYREFDYNCYGDYYGSVWYGLSVQAKSASSEKSENIDGFVLSFIGDGESVSVEAKLDSQGGNELWMLNYSKQEIEVPKNGKVRTYVYNGTKKFEKVEIYPLLKSGRVCAVNDVINVEGNVCGGSVNLEVY